MTSNFVNCPYCDGKVEILELNCRIFRHGIFKETGRQIGQHLKEDFVNKLLNENKIWGCGLQFKIQRDDAIIRTTGL